MIDGLFITPTFSMHTWQRFGGRRILTRGNYLAGTFPLTTLLLHAGNDDDLAGRRTRIDDAAMYSTFN
jgi:hypothetical protein